jgi:hypothetical protein
MIFLFGKLGKSENPSGAIVGITPKCLIATIMAAAIGSAPPSCALDRLGVLRIMNALAA